jgi:hypothetical protein
MEKIEILLEKLDNKVTSTLAKRLDSYEDLNDELDTLGKEYEENPSDENRAKYNEIIENFEKIELGIIVDLEALLEKRKAEALAKEQKANEPAPAPTPNPSSNPTTETKVVKEEKKEGTGVLTLVIGGALLIASFGAINYFRKQ